VGVTEDWPLALVPPNDLGGLAIAEGIEDALSLHQATGLGAWAAAAAGRLPKLAPRIARLSYVEHVTIALDDDANGRRYAGELVTELRRLRHRSLEIAAVELGEAAVRRSCAGALTGPSHGAPASTMCTASFASGSVANTTSIPSTLSSLPPQPKDLRAIRCGCSSSPAPGMRRRRPFRP
jgi:hypothetical protein